MFTDKEERQIDRAVRRAAKVIDNELEKMFLKLPESAAEEMAMRLVGELLVKSHPTVTPFSRPIMTPLDEVRDRPRRDPRAQRSPLA